MMFKYTLQRPDLAVMIQSAVEKALNDGIKTQNSKAAWGFISPAI
tara:strand:+ start:984 stop:1118 length:135 start_codon:yes stop_codon:yes gene_type:complete